MPNNFKKLESILLLALLISTLAVVFTPVPVSAPLPESFENFGPRVDSILVKVYAGRDLEFGALQSGQIDVVDWPLDYTTYQTLLSKPNEYVVAPLTMFDMYNLEMNCRQDPTDDVNVRRAIAYLCDKDRFYTEQLKSFSGVLLDSPIAPEWSRWHNPSVKQYPYNPNLAKTILTNAGYYDDDGDGFREVHNSTGRFEMTPLKFYIRSDDPDRKVFGEWLNYDLVAAGLPVDEHIVPKTVCWYAVMAGAYDYNLYTGGWGPWRDPDYLYDMYHSDFGIGWLPKDWANNYVFFTNSSYDSWAEQLKFAATADDAVLPAMKCQEILMDQVPMVPGWHSAGATGARKNYGHWAGEERYWDQPWTGWVNTETINGMTTAGLNGWQTFLNVHPGTWERGGTIRYGFMTDADVMNPVHADFYFDWEALNKVYDFLLSADPYQDIDIPYLAKEWTVGTWNGPSGPATKIDIKLYDNILWHDNVRFTAADVKFTLEYMKAAFSTLFYFYVSEFNHADIIDDYTLTIYYNVKSCWALHWVSGVPMIPKHIWQSIPPENARTQGEFETTGKLTGTGPYRYVNRKKGEWMLFEDNPTYFRRLIRPDWFTTGQPVPTFNGKVDLDDFMAAVGHYGDGYPWPHSSVDPWADVNKDLIIELTDIMEIGAHFGQTGYKFGYPGYYNATHL